jgi:hypothetical protein
MYFFSSNATHADGMDELFSAQIIVTHMNLGILCMNVGVS